MMFCEMWDSPVHMIAFALCLGFFAMVAGIFALMIYVDIKQTKAENETKR